MRVKVSDGFTQRLTNPAQVEEMKDRTGIATFDPNTKPVENGLIPDAPKEKTGEVAESLLEGFDERVVTFKAAVMSPSVNHVYVSIVDGPAQGYVWDIRRLVASFPLLLQEGNFTTGTKAYLYSVPAGQLPDSSNLPLNVLLLADSWKYLCGFEFSATLNSDGWMLEPYDFGRLQMTIRNGESIAVICTANDAGNGALMVEGQAIEIPEARLRFIR